MSGCNVWEQVQSHVKARNHITFAVWFEPMRLNPMTAQRCGFRCLTYSFAIGS
jgi:hypothetical protein